MLMVYVVGVDRREILMIPSLTLLQNMDIINLSNSEVNISSFFEDCLEIFTQNGEIVFGYLSFL